MSKFIQPLEDIFVVAKSGSGTLLSPEAIEAGRQRVAAGEDIDKVAADLALDEFMLLEDISDEQVDFRSLGGPGSGNFGHAGRPGERGGSSSALVEHVTSGSDLATEETRLQNEKYEHGAVLRDGKVVMRMTSNASDFIILPDVASEDGQQLKDATFTHNHPDSAKSFSQADIHLAVDFNVKELRAVTTRGTYQLKRIGTEWPSNVVTEAKKALADAKEELASNFKWSWNPLKLTKQLRADADSLHDAAWRKLASRIDVIYTFEAR